MIYLKKFEDIKIPIKVGDTILGGRFKNKKTIVKKIGKNDKGDITVNGKPLLKYRLLKESLESFEEDSTDFLLPIKDAGLSFEVDSIDDSIFIRIYDQIGNEKYNFDSPTFEWDRIKTDIQAYIGHMTEEFGYYIANIYTIGSNTDISLGFKRTIHKESEILGDKELGIIKCISIEFKR